MNRKTLFFSILWLGCLFGTLDANAHYLFQTDQVSYAEVDLSKKNASVSNPSGTSSVKSVKLTSTSGATFNSVYGACWLTDRTGKGITFTLSVTTPGMVQIAMEVATVIQGSNETASFNVKVGGTVIPGMPVTDTNTSYHLVVYQIPENLIIVGNNKVEVYLNSNSPSDLFVRNAKFLPQKITSSKGNLTTTLYTQFGETNQVTGATITEKDPVTGKNVTTPVNTIWTRAYGLSKTAEMIPGPTLMYNPGDLVSVNLVNLLNPDSTDVLAKYDSLALLAGNGDEILAEDTLRGELNIPHNLNNTNLHVHGLHVDPSKDDVTIVIVPDGQDTSTYDAPHTHAPVSSIGELNEYSVADQGVKAGSWDYQYKIPIDHLPGTHWFHPHKHGATSAQVENGLAGTMVIQEADSNAIVPVPGKTNSVAGGTQSAYDLTEWRNRHDRVLAIQEITNFGAQPGAGNGLGQSIKVSGDTDITVNGTDSLVLQINPGQLERWRLVNAGTNHKAFSHIWLGMETDRYDTVYVPANQTATYKLARIYKSVPVFLAAVDGITLPQLDTVTASNPALMAPGNRSDFLVQLEDKGNYVLFKNYNALTNMAIEESVKNAEGVYTDSIVFNTIENTPSFTPATSNSKNNPYLFTQTGTTPSNYGGFVKPWTGNKSPVPVLPLIKTELIDQDNFLDVNFATVADFLDGTKGKWQPGAINAGGISEAELVYINVTGDAVSPASTPQMPTDAYLTSIAPASSWAPDYASKIENTDILQSRPVIFDASGVGFEVENKPTKAKNNVNQFTLNGRFFILNDPIGNTESDTLITDGRKTPTDVEYTPDQPTIEANETITFRTATSAKWATNKVGDEYFFMNPGYYQALNDNGSTYSYSGTGTPSWADLTGLPNYTTGKLSGKQRTAAINVNSTHYANNKDMVPNLPLSQTAEEWVMINNSDISHPFHIHINPFFVVEVGQLSYEKYTDGKGAEKEDWFMRAVTADTWGPQRPEMPATGAVPGTVYKGEIGVDAIVGNWWDTIIIPAHGYVKVRYWFNVPNQEESKSGKISVVDNFNKTGIWVYHCHILRHEDRGMMMPVITLPQNETAPKKD